MKTVKFQSSAKLIVNKSHFYGYVFPLNKFDEIKEKILKIRKEHKGCNHVAYAFKINEEENYSDDGEPCKSAGMPLFNLIKNNKLDKILICVARIFGGVKLGVSGLRSAYSEAGKLALSENEIIEIQEIKEVIKEMSVIEFSKFEKELKKKKINFKAEFENNKVIVHMKLLI